MNTRYSIRSWALCVLWALSALALAAELTVIELRHRPAAEVIPVLKPLVGQDVALSAVDYKLLVRGGAGDVAAIRQALAMIDRAPRQWLVSVRYSGESNRNGSTASISGTVDSSGARGVIHGGATQRTSSDTGVSSVRVLEGNVAHISTGQSIPIVSALAMGRGRGAVVVNDREVSSGMTVLPRVNGETVTLEVSAHAAQLDARTPGAAHTQRVNTVISGKVGEWIELGGVEESATQRSVLVGAGATRRVGTANDAHVVAVKVEPLDSAR